MNYLKITNKGLIVSEDMMLIGSSTKRESTNKIGMFGSGWKYALAWLLRNECNPIIMSGKNRINIDTKLVLHRDNPVQIITVDDKETSLTTQMGPKWSGWMALREILSNAIDEGEHTMTTVWEPESFLGEESITSIYIPLNGELSEVMMKFDNYFAFNRKPSFENSIGKIYIKKDESEINIYRKGIRCYESTMLSMVDFDFYDININEDRLAQMFNVHSCIGHMVSNGIPTNILLIMLKSNIKDVFPANTSVRIIDNLKELLQQGHKFTTTAFIRLGGSMLADSEAIVIPQAWYAKLQEMGLVPSLFELLDGGDEPFMRTDIKDVSGIKYHLSGFNIDINVYSGKCESHVFVCNDKAYVKDSTHLNDAKLAAIIMSRLSEDFYESKML